MGVLLRLHCSAFVFTEELRVGAGTREEAVAFVPCELSWPSLLLQRTVVHELALRHVPIGDDALVLSATHTHASPAHYLGPANYAGLLSTEKPGFSADMLHFLATRIADAVEDAYRHRAPACIAWSKASFRDSMPPEADADRDRGPWVLDTPFAKNRAIAAFARDVLTDEERGIFLDPRARSGDPVAERAARPALYAVDGGMRVLRIDRCEGDKRSPLGAFVVVGVHPTGIANVNELYHGDIFGYAVRDAETRIRDEVASLGSGFVVGIANGIEGDVSPVIDEQGPREARRVGGLLATEIKALWNDAGNRLSSDTPLRRVYRELDLEGARVEAKNDFYDKLRASYPFPGSFRDTATTCGESAAKTEPTIPGACDPILCDIARLGTAAAGGAPDGHTFFYSIPITREGAIAPLSTSCHAPKFELDVPIPDAFAFPKRAPIFAVLLGGELVTTFPGEVSTLAAFRARRQLETYLANVGGPRAADASRASRAEVVALGLTGEYLQYMTTSEEYGAQLYEGASSLYGPNEARFIANQQLCLTRWLFEADIDRASDEACTLDAGVGTRSPQPRVGEVAAIEFEPGQTRAGSVSAACESGVGHFFPAGNDDRDARPMKWPSCSADRGGARPSCGENLYRLTRDGERGYGLRWHAPRGCGSEAYAPRVRAIDAETGDELASDEGDGFEIHWVHGDWRIDWYPSERETAHARSRPFYLEVTPGPCMRPEISGAASAACWDWTP